MKVLKGKTSKITQHISCMIEAGASNNLPMGIVINRTTVTPNKSKQVPVALLNTNSYYVWIWQPLFAIDIVEGEDCPWDYQPVMSHGGNQIKVSFCPVPSSEVQEKILLASISNTTETSDLTKSSMKESGEKSKFGPWPQFDSHDFDFRKELDWLPFLVNTGEVELTKVQKQWFLELIYDHQSMFPLCDEDLGLCDHLKHTIPTTMDKSVYLPHCTILVQLQTEVCKCLNTWLQQGIIHPS